jgi:Tol biopolymer transport system component
MMTRRLSLIGSVVVSALLVPASSSSLAANTGADAGQLTFAASGVGIYAVNGDGSGLRRLTRGKLDEDPTWSRDGSRIAFVRRFVVGDDRGEPIYRNDLYVMNSGGGGVRRLIKNGRDPVWSPDGRRVAFVRDQAEIWWVGVDGRSVRPLARGKTLDREPAWSPNGRTIAFTRAWPEKLQVFLMNSGGTGKRKLLRSQLQSSDPQWSPYGRLVAFFGFESHRLYVANADGGRPRSLTGDVSVIFNDEGPKWSPDASEILFVRNTSAIGSDVYAVDIASGLEQRLAGGAADPEWSYDGQTVAFIGLSPDASFDAFQVMSADGGESHPLVLSAGVGTDWIEDLSWRP